MLTAAFALILLHVSSKQAQHRPSENTDVSDADGCIQKMPPAVDKACHSCALHAKCFSVRASDNPPSAELHAAGPHLPVLFPYSGLPTCRPAIKLRIYELCCFFYTTSAFRQLNLANIIKFRGTIAGLQAELKYENKT